MTTISCNRYFNYNTWKDLRVSNHSVNGSCSTAVIPDALSSLLSHLQESTKKRYQRLESLCPEKFNLAKELICLFEKQLLEEKSCRKEHYVSELRSIFFNASIDISGYQSIDKILLIISDFRYRFLNLFEKICANYSKEDIIALQNYHETYEFIVDIYEQSINELQPQCVSKEEAIKSIYEKYGFLIKPAKNYINLNPYVPTCLVSKQKYLMTDGNVNSPASSEDSSSAEGQDDAVIYSHTPVYLLGFLLEHLSPKALDDITQFFRTPQGREMVEITALINQSFAETENDAQLVTDQIMECLVEQVDLVDRFTEINYDSDSPTARNCR